MQTNKVALITGASRGIGAQTAKQFAKAGYAVAINYPSNRQAAQGVAQYINHIGGKSILLQGDIANEDDVKRVFNTIDQRLGPLSVLVNNAGILRQQCKLVELTAERINTVLKTNVTGSFLCCIEAIKRMVYSHGGNGGTIINVSSMAAKTGSPNEYIDYAA